MADAAPAAAFLPGDARPRGSLPSSDVCSTCIAGASDGISPVLAKQGIANELAYGLNTNALAFGLSGMADGADLRELLSYRRDGSASS